MLHATSFAACSPWSLSRLAASIDRPVERRTDAAGLRRLHSLENDVGALDEPAEVEVPDRGVTRQHGA